MTTATRMAPIVNGKEEKIKRFDVHQIIQHASLMTSFTLLVLTGLPLKFDEVPLSQWWVHLWGGMEVTRTAHHVGAWMMALVCLYHIIYLWYTTAVMKRPFPVKIIPGRQDVIQLYQEMAYYLGLRKKRPLVDRFNWKEKFDYWAIFWGMPVMFLSGFVMMYPVFVTRFLPGWIVPTALVAHSEEAMLALIWIAMVHIFFSHFTPSTFPINTVIFTGKMTREKYKHEHPLEYERLTGETVTLEDSATDGAKEGI